MVLLALDVPHSRVRSNALLAVVSTVATAAGISKPLTLDAPVVVS